MEVILPGAQYRKDREVCSDIGKRRIEKSGDQKIQYGKTNGLER